MLIGQTVTLGPILPTDLAQLFVWSDDPALARLNEPYIPKNLQREAEFWLNAGGDSSRVFLAIRLRTAPEAIGHVQITNIHPIHRSATLGVLIGDAGNRGKGLGSEALRLAIAYCWNHLNLSRLALAVQTRNTGAIALYERLGFATEGTLRHAQFIAGEWIDLTLMALMQPGR